MRPLRYTPYHRLDGRPNVVVDGSPTAGTLLTLSHWPGYPPPPGLGRDTSAGIVFAYLDAGAGLHGGATEVSNNHFDQDGLVCLLALTAPGEALARRPLLEQVAAAGDFATWSDRSAARVAMALAAWASPEGADPPLPDEYGERVAQLYEELLGRLPAWCDDPDRARPLWEEEDAELDAALGLLAGGEVAVREHPEVDLAVLELAGAPRPGLRGGRRFAHARVPALHPFAVTRATDRFVVLTRTGRRWHLRYRYESWVTYRSRRPRARRDLRALADRLNGLDPAGAVWEGEPSGDIEPVLATLPDAESGLDPGTVEAVVVDHLATAPPDWDPYRAEG